MPTSIYPIPKFTFSGGEVSPGIYKRPDIEQYNKSLRKCKNAYVHNYGGVSRRAGTKYIATARNCANSTARIIPFQFNVEQTYVLEFTEQVEFNLSSTASYSWTASAVTGSYYCRTTASTNPNLTFPGQLITAATTSRTALTYALTVASTGSWTYGDFDSLGYNTIYVHLSDSADPDSKGSGWLTGRYGAVRIIKDGGVLVYPAGHSSEGQDVVITTPYIAQDMFNLKYCQSADVMYITHPSYPPAKLSRTADPYVWTWARVTFGASLAAPGSLTGTGSGQTYCVTAVAEDGEESLPSASKACDSTSAFGWGAVTGANSYNVYRLSSGTFYFISRVASGTSFTEGSTLITVDRNKTPPISKNPFNTTGNYPGCVFFYDQRLWYARTNNEPQTIWGSRIGTYDNFNSSLPTQDDDSCKFTIYDQQVNEIRGLAGMNNIIICGAGSEFKMAPGGNNSTITPTSVNVKVQSWYGASNLKPLVIGYQILFSQKAGASVRDLSYSIQQDGYIGNDLSVMADHLFKGYTLVDWAYQKYPETILWCVRNDGMLLGLTFLPDQEVIAWHQHVTDGYYESVCCISNEDGTEDVYFVVNRNIDGTDYRFIEMMEDGLPERDLEKSWYLDAALQYNGWNAGSGTLKLTGTTYAVASTATLTAVGHTPFGVESSVGDYYKLRISEFDEFDGWSDVSCLVQITTYSSSTSATVLIKSVVTASLQDVDLQEWGLCAEAVGGFEHLEGEQVYTLADGNVCNCSIVTSGSIEVDSPSVVILAGLNFTTDLETLELDPSGGDINTIQYDPRNITRINYTVRDTRQVKLGPDFDKLSEQPFRSDERWNAATRLQNGDFKIQPFAGTGNSSHVCMRCDAPVPMTITAIVPIVRFDK